MSHGGSSGEAPAWVKGRMPVDPEYIYFVGCGVGDNVLDEHAAHEAARRHATEQLARQVVTRVVQRTQRHGARKGHVSDADALIGLHSPIHRSWEHDDVKVAASRQQLQLITDAIVGDLEEREIYWERWLTRGADQRWDDSQTATRYQCCDRTLTRYKCWVLMAIPRHAFERRVAVTEKVLKLEQDRRDVKRAMANRVQTIHGVKRSRLRVIEANSKPKYESATFPQYERPAMWDPRYVTYGSTPGGAPAGPAGSKGGLGLPDLLRWFKLGADLAKNAEAVEHGAEKATDTGRKVMNVLGGN